MREITPLPRGSTEIASAGLTAQDQYQVQEPLDSYTSANTRSAYDQVWRPCRSWVEARERPARVASPRLVAAFLAACPRKNVLYVIRCNFVRDVEFRIDIY